MSDKVKKVQVDVLKGFNLKIWRSRNFPFFQTNDPFLRILFYISRDE